MRTHRGLRVLSLLLALLLATGNIIGPGQPAWAQLIQDGSGGGDSPESQPIDDVGDTGTVPPTTDALADVRDAIQLVSSMPFPDPDLTPPGKEQRKDQILIWLRVATTYFRSPMSVNATAPFDLLVSAVNRLSELVYDPKVDQLSRDRATQAMTELWTAARGVADHQVQTLQAFGVLNNEAQRKLRSAQQSLEQGDSKIADGKVTDAIRNYRDAWEYGMLGVSEMLSSTDPDGDGLTDEYEALAGTDPREADADGDGLPDGFEILRTVPFTSPATADSDGNGVADGDEDPDADGLTHSREYAVGTDPLVADTDHDELTDGFEVDTFGSSPGKYDTDADGLSDGSEYRLGTNPNAADTDGDGIWDGLEVYEQTIAGPTGASVTLTAIGDIYPSVEISDVSDRQIFMDMPGQMSAPVDFAVEVPFQHAVVTIPYDPAQVPNGDVQNLQVFWFDEASRLMVPLENATVDPVSRTVSAETSHFSTFVLFYVPNWDAAWSTTMVPRSDGDLTALVDLAFVLDSSGSMSTNDPTGIRKTAAKEFLSALISGDRVAVVDFDGSAKLYQGLTDNFDLVRAAIDRVDSSGSTNIGAGVHLANQELIQHGLPDRLRFEIVLTDGEGSYLSAYTQEAIENHIVIFTVGLGTRVDAQLLQEIAAATGGQYYPVASAADIPDAFSRIVPGPGVDSDGDGIPDSIEVNGARLGTGVLITSDPDNPDTDGDGMSDGAEMGPVQTQHPRGYYRGDSSPAQADSDSDGLMDAEERDIGTDAHWWDTDRDGLSDGEEMVLGFSPVHRNADADAYDDDQELANQTDPFVYDRTWLENVRDFALGLLIGAGGPKLVSWGWISQDTVESLWYLGGWIASGFVPVFGDLRDLLADLAQGSLVDAALDLVGLVPGVGDSGKVAKVLENFLGINPKLFVNTLQWITLRTQFLGNIRISLINQFTSGANDKLLLKGLRQGDVDQLLKARNNIQRLAGATLTYSGRAMDQTEFTDLMRRVTDKGWPAGRRIEGMAVEAAEQELLARGYNKLYLGGPNEGITQGIDGLFISPSGRPVILEAKGTLSGTALTDGGQKGAWLTSMMNVDGTKQPFTYLTRAWLEHNNGPRYMDYLRHAHPQAAAVMDEILDGQSYDTVVVYVAKNASLGRGMDIFGEVVTGSSKGRLTLIQLDVPPTGGG